MSYYYYRVRGRTTQENVRHPSSEILIFKIATLLSLAKISKKCCILWYMYMFMWLMIQVSVSVSFDTLTGAICHATIYVTNYTSNCACIKCYTSMCLWKTCGKPVENSLCGFSGIVSYVLDFLIGCRLRQ